jgi:hypothetical protein
MLSVPEVNGMVSVWVTFWITVGAVLPVLAIMLVVHLSAVLDRAESLAHALRRRRPAPPAAQPVERLAADLHRLAVHLDSVERSRELHRVARLRAAALAYDDVLLSACRTFEIEVPDGTPLQPVERLQTEAALAQCGLVW